MLLSPTGVLAEIKHGWTAGNRDTVPDSESRVGFGVGSGNETRQNGNIGTVALLPAQVVVFVSVVLFNKIRCCLLNQ
jgi:hypothetical protein